MYPSKAHSQQPASLMKSSPPESLLNMNLLVAQTSDEVSTLWSHHFSRYYQQPMGNQAHNSGASGGHSYPSCCGPVAWETKCDGEFGTFGLFPLGRWKRPKVKLIINDQVVNERHKALVENKLNKLKNKCMRSYLAGREQGGQGGSACLRTEVLCTSSLWLVICILYLL